MPRGRDETELQKSGNKRARGKMYIYMEREGAEERDEDDVKRHREERRHVE